VLWLWRRVVRWLARRPLIDGPVGRGSSRLKIRKEGDGVLGGPVLIERTQHGDGIRPGSSEPFLIALPRQGALGPTECYVPAGWFWAGGDPGAYDAWLKRRYWVDGFVMQKFPVTNRDYLVFLNDLVAQGREDEALQHVPRERAGQAGKLGAMICGRDAEGRFILVPDAEGDIRLPDYPVDMINWQGARAYADWCGRRSEKKWRLSMEHEWAKAARGVDGRFFPWGDYLDPSWCCMRESHPDFPLPAAVEDYPVDVSVYGVRGLGGNMRDWCEDIYSAETPPSGLAPVLASSDLTTPACKYPTSCEGSILNVGG